MIKVFIQTHTITSKNIFLKVGLFIYIYIYIFIHLLRWVYISSILSNFWYNAFWSNKLQMQMLNNQVPSQKIFWCLIVYICLHISISLVNSRKFEATRSLLSNFWYNAFWSNKLQMQMLNNQIPSQKLFWRLIVFNVTHIDIL